MMKLLKDKKGTSLMELMVAMIIFAMIATSVTMILVPTLREYGRATELAQINSMVNNVGNEISSDLSQSTESATIQALNTIDIQMANNQVTYTSQGTSNGRSQLMRSYNGGSPSPVFAAQYYRDKGVVVSYTEEDKTYTIEVALYDENDELLVSRNFIVRPLILN